MLNQVRGLVRPTVTFAFTAMVAYGFVSGGISGAEMLGMAGVVIGFWFRSRDEKDD